MAFADVKYGCLRMLDWLVSTHPHIKYKKHPKFGSLKWQYDQGVLIKLQLDTWTK
jgi:hypothetical protein